MALNFNRWTLLKLLELAASIGCLAFKGVTDVEASRLFLYLQKLSREWSLLNNVTWNGVGAALADATYGGYVIITSALFIGHLAGELPTGKRIVEYVLLGVGAILFIILGSLEFASLDSVPDSLVDNGAIIGTLTLVTAALFLVDMGGPKAVKMHPQTPPRTIVRPESKTIPQQVYDIERELSKTGLEMIQLQTARPNGVKKHAKSEKRSFDIYGRDGHDGPDDGRHGEVPPKMEEHSPVWSKIRKGQYGKYDVISPIFVSSKEKDDDTQPPSSPGDPGYVQYTAQHWGQASQKTPRHSPTQV